MKRILFCMLFAALTMGVCAQQADKARKILDKAATIVGHKGGASASFSIQSGNVGTTKGTIAIKGNMFHARTDKATMWYNGKTQWTYMKATNEVNITTPNAAKQAQLNPYKFLSLYKTGYQLSCGHLIKFISQPSTSSNRHKSFTSPSARLMCPRSSRCARLQTGLPSEFPILNSKSTMLRSFHSSQKTFRKPKSLI